MSERLEAFYATRDVLRRRSLALAALGARRGEHVGDLGCGPGYYVADLLDAVGAEGRVTGVDPAPAMRALAEHRVAGRGDAAILDGGATSIPLEDRAADRLLAGKVFGCVR